MDQNRDRKRSLIIPHTLIGITDWGKLVDFISNWIRVLQWKMKSNLCNILAPQIPSSWLTFIPTSLCLPSQQSRGDGPGGFWSAHHSLSPLLCCCFLLCVRITFSAPVWVHSHRRQSSMNFSNVSRSHTVVYKASHVATPSRCQNLATLTQYISFNGYLISYTEQCRFIYS